MLRLWPKRYVLSLFPAQSWLRVGNGLYEAITEQGDCDTGSLQSIADRLLSEAPVKEFWRPPLDVIVSDEVARVVVVPWQNRLRTSSQQMTYAEACLVDSGTDLDSSWLVQSGFRRYGSAGFALTMRRDFVHGLIATAAEHGLRLRSVMPASATAYWRYGGQSSGRASLLLLCENRRITGMRYSGRGLDSIDVQPTGGDEGKGILRLLRRQCAGSAMHKVIGWAAGDRSAFVHSMVGVLPDTKSEHLPRGVWE